MMFDFLAQGGVEISVGAGVAGVIVGAIGKQIVGNGKHVTKELCDERSNHFNASLVRIEDKLDKIIDKKDGE